MKVKMDFILIIVVILIFILGLFTLYSASYNFKVNYVEKQIIWFSFSIFIGSAIFIFGIRRFINYSILLYLFSFFLLIIVIFLPGEGAHRWIRIGFFSIQPSELMKFSLPFFLVSIFNHMEFNNIWSFFFPLLVTVLPAVIIAKEPDLGGALLLFPALITFFILKKAHFRKALFWIFLGVIILPLLYWHLEPYQKKRLLTFINPQADPLGTGYTLLQSKIAIGSGRILGKGWLNGVQGQLRFLPESHTDFIFPIFAEEWGFSGSMLLLFLYWIMLMRMKIIIENNKDNAVRTVLWLFLVTISVQIMVNIGMTMGIFPIVGLPLPLFSYGGSDLIVTTSIIAIFLSCSRRR